MCSIHKILVPLDFSPGSHAALDQALSLARSLGASVTLLHVWAPSGVLTPRVHVPGQEMETLLDQAGRELGREHVDGRIETGDPATRILETAEQSGSDLIVMGTRHAGLSRLLLGSVTEQVVHRAQCPVLTVRVRSRHGARAADPA